MGRRRTVTVAGGVLLAVCTLTAAADEVPRDASVAIGYEAKSRCPDLAAADTQDGSAALVLFVVGPTGVPSRASIKSSSGSASLDAAAVSCVLRLKYLPAVHAGDGNAIASWQEIAWKWGRGHGAQDSGGGPVTPAAPGTAEVRACVDASGQLAQDPVMTRSSGDSAFDAAALRVARSASGSYRPPAGADGHPAPGCLRLAISAEGLAHP
jgi:TonB family protein